MELKGILQGAKSPYSSQPEGAYLNKGQYFPLEVLGANLGFIQGEFPVEATTSTIGVLDLEVS